MLKHTLPAITAIALSLVPLNHGAILVLETFDYTVGANIGGVAATGEGLTGNWQRTFTDSSTAILRVYEYEWNLPTGYQHTALDKRVGTPVDQGNSAAVNLVSGAQINFDADGVFYYSYLLSYGTDNRSRLSFGSAATPDLMRVQGIADGTLRVYVGGDFTAGGALAANRDYLVVGRITTSASGNDLHQVWVYRDDDTVPGSFDDVGTAYAAQSGTITGTASMLQFSNVIDASYGTFAMGTTWESVVIPEPSTYAALLGLGAFALMAYRRRRQR